MEHPRNHTNVYDEADELINTYGQSATSHEHQHTHQSPSTSMHVEDDRHAYTNLQHQQQQRPSVTMEGSVDPELDELRHRMKEMEEESKKLFELQKTISANLGLKTQQAKSTSSHDAAAHKAPHSHSPQQSSAYLAMQEKNQKAAEEANNKSIHVSNVDYSATDDDLHQLFDVCGKISRLTRVTDKITGQAKGYAFIEFADVSSVENALALTDSVLKNRQITVVAKRHNVPGYYSHRGHHGHYRGARGGPMMPMAYGMSHMGMPYAHAMGAYPYPPYHHAAAFHGNQYSPSGPSVEGSTGASERGSYRGGHYRGGGGDRGGERGGYRGSRGRGASSSHRGRGAYQPY